MCCILIRIKMQHMYHFNTIKLPWLFSASTYWSGIKPLLILQLEELWSKISVTARVVQ